MSGDDEPSEEGSVLPLVIGYTLVALALILVCVNATGLMLAQHRLEALADSVALAAAEQFTVSVENGSAQVVLREHDVLRSAEDFVELARDQQGMSDIVLRGADAPDGVTARVVLTDVWHPAIVSVFVPDGVPLTATGTSRVSVSAEP